MDRDECRDCLGVMERLGEIWSTACRWLWGLLRATECLDDDREAQEIAEARTAHRRLVARMAAAMQDGRITATERAECMALAVVADRELADVEAYDRRENELHQQVAHCATRARATIAPLSRAADRAQAACATANGGITEPVWEIVGAQMTAAGE